MNESSADMGGTSLMGPIKSILENEPVSIEETDLNKSDRPPIARHCKNHLMKRNVFILTDGEVEDSYVIFFSFQNKGVKFYLV